MQKTLVFESYTVIEKVDGMTIVEIDFSDFGSAFAIGNLSEFDALVTKEVDVTFRDEVYKGGIQKFVNYIVEHTKVATLDKEENIKLYVDKLPETGSNVDFRDFDVADFHMNCIVYCDGVSTGSSSKASWVDLNVLDRNRNSTKLKIFNPENMDANVFRGKYIICDLRKTKFGFSTQEVRVKEDISIFANPEFELARMFLRQELSDDTQLLSELDSIGFFNAAMAYCDPVNGVETGHVLMEIAVAVAVAAAMKNITNKIDVQLLKRAIVCRRLYVLTDSDSQVLSKNIQSVIRVAALSIKSKKLMAMLEDRTRKPLIEKMVMDHIEEMSRIITNTSRSMLEALSTSKVWK